MTDLCYAESARTVVPSTGRHEKATTNNCGYCLQLKPSMDAKSRGQSSPTSRGDGGGSYTELRDGCKRCLHMQGRTRKDKSGEAGIQTK